MVYHSQLKWPKPSMPHLSTKSLLIISLVGFIAIAGSLGSWQWHLAHTGPCPEGQSYVYRIIGGYERTPATNPLGQCVSDETLKTMLVEQPTVWRRLIHAVRSSLRIEKARAARNTYYVATNGDDSRTCSKAQNPSTPRRTINNGIRCLASGDTLIIRQGTYEEGICGDCGTAQIPSGTGWDHVTTIKGAPGEEVILRGKEGTDGIISFDHESYISIENMILDGNNYQVVYAIGLNVEHGASNATNASNHIRFKDLELRYFRWCTTGISQTRDGAGGYHEFINIYVHDSGIEQSTSGPDPGGNPGCHSFYISAGNNLFDHIIADGKNVRGKTMYAMHVYTASGQQKANNVIRNSTFRNYATAIGLFAADNAFVYNNIIYNNKQGIWNGSAGVKIFNNTISSNRDCGILTGRDVDVRNNILYANGNDICEDGGHASASNNLMGTNPGFVNASAGDFHLTPSSPAIDAGVSLPEVPCDKDGNKRPAGAAYDIGAYEYGSSLGGGCKSSAISGPKPTSAKKDKPGKK